MTGYNWKYQFGIAFTSNSASSLNCSGSIASFGKDVFFIDALCPVYDAVLAVVTNGTAPRLNCSSCPSCPPQR